MERGPGDTGLGAAVVAATAVFGLQVARMEKRISVKSFIIKIIYSQIQRNLDKPTVYLPDDSDFDGSDISRRTNVSAPRRVKEQSSRQQSQQKWPRQTSTTVKLMPPGSPPSSRCVAISAARV
ncbi:hypothetical protein GWI33_011424 [Rhynchophorus ferrugineus]|uniref:Uncharacterized protein n=1 Tax=Rhynchophorus ferrugineus TaxID=354439 RepID=A0A834IWS1_RHYFE|nr:hypothetical protein GWI33_011424 [Rhynchophorus ferrugineus]